MFRRLALLFLLTTANIFAQDGSTGAVRGTVTDASRAAIVSANVKLEDKTTGVVRATQTDAQGGFVFDLLMPATYSLAINAPGMADYSATDIKVDIGANVTLSVMLRIAGSSETVNVSDATPVV